jgi:ADP-heptose:LPS heptosyltransferase
MTPGRILIILPCCIGDVVLGTAALAALRRAYPSARIVWAVGSWSRPALDGHPALSALLDTGAGASPVRSLQSALRFARQIRAERPDWLIAFSRSTWISLAAALSGVRVRAGLDSGGRGFGYTVRVPLNPDAPRHEAEIYLDVVRALGVDTAGCFAHVPVTEADRAFVRARLAAHDIGTPYAVVNPAGGRNPGMIMDAKRYPPDKLAALANRLALPAVVIGAADDAPLVEAVRARLAVKSAALAGALSFGQIGALAQDAVVYIGNDTGLTHYAAGAGARAVMIMGPTDPRRYAPFAPGALALWKPAAVAARGVSAGARPDWDWERDGISVDEAWTQLEAFVRRC